MSANSQQKASTINRWLIHAEEQLKAAGITTARLDSELILAYALSSSRTFLHAHGDEKLTSQHVRVANIALKRRSERTPLAYITGSKEFFGRLFKVDPLVLIPRPESETIIEMVRSLIASHKIPTSSTIADVGTGSGCLAITICLEAPDSHVFASDISDGALKIARSNAAHLKASVTFVNGYLLEPYETLDCIIANLPYVDRSWDVSPETHEEPDLALYATNEGLQLIYELIQTAPSHQKPGGYLILESDPRQHNRISDYAHVHGYTLEITEGFIQAFRYQ